jgi:hypothetical protein
LLLHGLFIFFAQAYMEFDVLLQKRDIFVFVLLCSNSRLVMRLEIHGEAMTGALLDVVLAFCEECTISGHSSNGMHPEQEMPSQ